MPGRLEHVAKRKAVVVLPLVPVIPTTRSSAVGSPWKRAAAGPIAARTSGDHDLGHAQVQRPLADQRRRAPLDGVRGEVVPVGLEPGTQKKSVPGGDALPE